MFTVALSNILTRALIDSILFDEQDLVVPVPHRISVCIQALSLDVPAALTRDDWSIFGEANNPAISLELLDASLQLRVLANGGGDAAAHLANGFLDLLECSVIVHDLELLDFYFVISDSLIIAYLATNVKQFQASFCKY